MMNDEIISTSPVFVYKILHEEPTRFISFCADDILYLEEVHGHHVPNPDFVEKVEGTCVVLKGSTHCMHVDVKFQEIMLRWMNFKESKNG